MAGFGESVVQGFDVAGLHKFDVRYQRLEFLTDGGLPRCGQRAHGTAVETVGHGDDACRFAADLRRRARQGAPVELGELQRRLVTFRAGIAEVDAGTFRSARELDEFGGELDLRFGGEVVAHMRGLGGLLADGLHPLRMGVSERVDGDACKEIEIFIAVDIPDVGALTVVHHAQGRAKHVHMHLGVLSQPLGIFSAECFQLFSCHRNSSFQYRPRARPWCRCRRW